MTTQDFGELFQRLETGDYTLRRADFEQLSDLNRSGFVAFCDGWPNIPVEARRRVVAALVQMACDSYEYSFDRVLRRAIEDPDAEVRAKAIEGLWESEDASLVGPLIRLLESDSEESVRAAAAAGLGQYIYLAEVEEIEAAVGLAVETALLRTLSSRNESIEVQRRAVEAISFSCNPAVSDLIQDAYEHEDPRMRVSALFGMGRSADRRWSNIVLRELSSTDSLVRFEAARAAGELELREAVPSLANLIAQDDDPDICLAAVRSLGQTGGKAARRILQRIITSGDPALLNAAQEALEEWSFVAESPEVSELLWGPSENRGTESDGFDDGWRDEDYEDGDDSMEADWGGWAFHGPKGRSEEDEEDQDDEEDGDFFDLLEDLSDSEDADNEERW